MFNFKKVGAISIVLVLMSSCVSGILNVDQDRYSAGTSLDMLPSKVILGPPDGDRFGTLYAPVFVTDDTAFDLGRAIRIGERAEFKTDPEHAVPDRYQIVWTGSRESIGRVVTNIIFRDEQGDEAVRVRYELNRIDVVWGDDVGIGYATLQPNLPHEIRVVLDMNGGHSAGYAANVTITQGDEVILERNNLDFIDSAFRRLDVVEVRTQTNYDIKDLIAITLQD
ncbi:hypothetical protein RS130_22460 [Paraglaciecola aquimarina]|uniref:Lipoprotein n=1 Tax=Paraglaciecola aquimarina TaxID=1235557 RepID=A0ABU3T1Y6_9ALTE|nr:hypothetical protein [Paraglaciecola aquimarina]MDU0356279.1 hypothetical protein [Paraglaciecola aquimarina]